MSRTVLPVVYQKKKNNNKLKKNKQGEDRLRGSYEKGSKSREMRKQRSARELEKETLKNIKIFRRYGNETVSWYDFNR